MAIPTLTRPTPSAKTDAPVPSGPAVGARHLCFDIETGNASEDAISLSADFYKAPANMKDPEKIKEREAKAIATMREKSALLDLAPIYVVGSMTESAAVLFHHIKAKKKVESLKNIPAEIFTFKSERDMLGAYREWIDPRFAPNQVIVGHNIKSFDLPKIRGAFVRNRLVLPKVFSAAAKEGGVEVYDTMKEFLYGFTTELYGDKYVTQEEMVARLGIPGHKHRLSGAEIPGLIAQGKAEEVLAYNYLDFAEAYAAFLAMTGQYRDQPHQ
jgi:hypothetical protein